MIIRCETCVYYTPKKDVKGVDLAIGYCDGRKRPIRKIVKRSSACCSQYLLRQEENPDPT